MFFARLADVASEEARARSSLLAEAETRVTLAMTPAMPDRLAKYLNDLPAALHASSRVEVAA